MEGLSTEEEKYLKSIYYDKSHPGGFSGLNGLKRVIDNEGLHKISLKTLKTWLSSQEAYSTFKQPNLKFDKPRLVVYGKNQQWDVDTVNLKYYAKWNSDYKFILVCVDIFTRFVITRPLESLLGESVKEAFTDIFKYNQKPKKIRSDRGVRI